MTTRELYFKVKYLADMPVASMIFTLKDKDGAIQLCGGSLCISFHDDIDDTLKKIETAEKSDGFMFWNNSPEGERFYHDNWDVVGKLLTNIVLNQK